MDTVQNSNVSQINEVDVEEEIAKNGFEISFGRESIEPPAQLNNRGANKEKSTSGKREIKENKNGSTNQSKFESNFDP